MSCVVSGGHVTVTINHVIGELDDGLELAKFDHLVVVFEADLEQGEALVILRGVLEGGSHILKGVVLGEAVQV